MMSTCSVTQALGIEVFFGLDTRKGMIKPRSVGPIYKVQKGWINHDMDIMGMINTATEAVKLYPKAFVS
jgi:hypothetical protein